MSTTEEKFKKKKTEKLSFIRKVEVMIILWTATEKDRLLPVYQIGGRDDLEKITEKKKKDGMQFNGKKI